MIGAISVKDRLKNRAIATGKTMQETLTAYGLESIPVIDSINNGYEPYFVWNHTTGSWKQQT